jgi:hypothetical protein
MAKAICYIAHKLTVMRDFTFQLNREFINKQFCFFFECEDGFRLRSVSRTGILCVFLFALIGARLNTQAQTPEVTSWILNLDGTVGYNSIETNVQIVQYSSSNVYVHCTCIPGYDIGPWTGNPNIPSNQNFVFKITRNPQPNTGTLTSTSLGHTGVLINGVSIFNALDAFSYNNANIWHQDAKVVEGLSFDLCLGHPAPNGEYHHHINPTCLYSYDAANPSHSPIIGFAFDGYPIYGAFAYQNTDGTGPVVRMQSGWQLRNITTRNTLSDGTVLSGNQIGPVVSTQYPLGYYVEDYEFISSSGALDEHNGRYCVTPEYPNGTYAYFATLDEGFEPAYPYLIGPKYYGVVQSGNTGPGSGHNTVGAGENVLVYSPLSSNEKSDIRLSCYPNPMLNELNFQLPANSLPCLVTVFGFDGREVFTKQITSSLGTIDFSGLQSGGYVVTFNNKQDCRSVRVFKASEY